MQLCSMEPVVGKTSFTLNFKKLPAAALIALSVISSLYFVELYVLPINFFTFRLYEALKVEKILPGSFYPNMKVSMVETGDLGHHTKYAVKKNVEWETDRYGYRKKDTGVNRYQVVIVGDSNVVGSSLNQPDMISEVLERRLKISAYPFTGDDFLNTKRFIDNPPDIVILESIERNIPALWYRKPGDANQEEFSWLKKRLKFFWDTHQNLVIALDRIYKNNMAHYFVDRIKYIIKYPFYRLSKQEWLPSIAVQSNVDKKMIFMKETVDKMASGKDISPEEINRIVDTIIRYAQICREGQPFYFSSDTRQGKYLL